MKKSKSSRLSKDEMKEFTDKRAADRKKRRAVSSKRRAKKQNSIRNIMDGDPKTIQKMLQIRY